MADTLTTKPHNVSGEANTLEFIMRRFLDRHSFTTLCMVLEFDEDKKQVSVKPMVHEFTGAGDKIDNEVIHGIPVMRLQRGGSAVIMDPVPGDIGMMLSCDRDISVVKSTSAPALPGSNRMHSYSDAIYLGGVINGEPTQYIRFADDGLHIVAPKGLFIDGPVQTTSTIIAAGDITAGGISLETHVHGGVESGNNSTSGPQ